MFGFAPVAIVIRGLETGVDAIGRRFEDLLILLVGLLELFLHGIKISKGQLSFERIPTTQGADLLQGTLLAAAEIPWSAGHESDQVALGLNIPAVELNRNLKLMVISARQ